MINFRSDRGSVTMYVLAAMSFLTIALIAVYMSVTNKQITQLDVSEQIKSVYEKDINSVNVIYDALVSGD